MKKISIALLCIVFSTTLFSQNFDVKSYNYILKVNDINDSISVTASILVKKNNDLNDTLKINLINKNAEYKGMTVSKIVVNDFFLDKIIHKNDTIYLPINKKTNNISVDISYSGIPKDGFIISKNKFGDRTFFSDNWPFRASHWLACIDNPLDKAKVSFEVYAPSKYQVVANGTLTNIKKFKDFSIHKWICDFDIPTKVMAVGIAEFSVEKIPNTTPTLSSWIFKQESDSVHLELKKTKKIVNFFSKKIGRFPFSKLAGIQSKTKYGGMENASAIFYNENAFNGKFGSEKLIAHEVAHQWFGNSVTEKNFRHLWLSEGFATYLADIYMAETHSKDSLISSMKKSKKRIFWFKKSYPNAVVLPKKIGDTNFMLNPYSYQKGAWILHMIRYKMGDDLFWKSMREFYEKYKYSNASTLDFKNILEDVSKVNFTNFFSNWLLKNDIPKYSIKYNYDSTEKTLEGVLLQNNDILFEIPVELQFNFEDKTSIIRKIEPKSKRHIFKIKNIENIPVEILIDPNNWILKIENSEKNLESELDY